MERLAAEEYERDRVRGSRTRPDFNLPFEPSEAWPSSSRSSTPSSFASHDDTEGEPETETPVTAYAPSENGRNMSVHLVQVLFIKLRGCFDGEMHI